MSYEDTANEVLAQYDLTDKQRKELLPRIMATGCPWFRRDVYTRSHCLASEEERKT